MLVNDQQTERQTPFWPPLLRRAAAIKFVVRTCLCKRKCDTKPEKNRNDIPICVLCSVLRRVGQEQLLLVVNERLPLDNPTTRQIYQNQESYSVRLTSLSSESCQRGITEL